MLLDEMAARVTAEGLVSSGYALRRGVMPASPDQVIVLGETGGAGPEIAFDGGVVEQPGLQIRVRGAADDYESPRNAIEVLHQAIVGWGAFTSAGVRYLGLTALQSPFPLRRDENNRQEFSANYLVQKEPS